MAAWIFSSTTPALARLRRQRNIRPKSGIARSASTSGRPFCLLRAAARPMIAQKSGRIINMASQAAWIGIAGHVAYCTSKAGLLGMTRCMALEWGPKGLTVNAISPTVVETELGLKSWSGEIGVRARAAIPAGRFAKPWEIAAAVLFLSSPGAAMINGADLAIDGGYTIV